jgi:hypothetical protein
MSKLVEIGNSFWNLRGSFTVLFGAIDVGTHMSFVKLSTGKFLVVDTCQIDEPTKIEIDNLTENGLLIEAVIATHPFHTMYFVPFFKLYPNTKYYGTPRHIRNIPSIPWAGNLNSDELRASWEKEGVYMRIPDGADFENPAEKNHFISVFFYHALSKTIHVDDTINFFSKPGFVLRCAGLKDGDMHFHPTTFNIGLKPTAEAPIQFKEWVENLLNDWDFDNICSAHTGNKIGGAKEQLRLILEKTTPAFMKLSEKNKLKTQKK